MLINLIILINCFYISALIILIVVKLEYVF